MITINLAPDASRVPALRDAYILRIALALVSNGYQPNSADRLFRAGCTAEKVKRKLELGMADELGVHLLPGGF